MIFYPAILSDSIEEISHQLQIVKSLKQVKVVQIDIIDGLFADNLTITPSDLLALDFADLKIDLHLMINEPMDCVHELIDLNQQLPVRVAIAQVEHLSFQADFLQELKDQQLQTGFSLDLFTPIEAIDTESFSQLNYLQLMAIEAGLQGQALDESIYQKLSQLTQLRSKQQLDFKIIVDGGVKLDNIEQLKKAGADAVAIGSMLWQSADPQQLAKTITSI